MTTDPTLPLDLARHLRDLERRIGELERGNPLNRAAAYDGTRTRVEVGAFAHPVSAAATFGLHVVDDDGTTVLLMTDDGDETGASELVAVTSPNWENYGGGWPELRVTRYGRVGMLTGLIRTTATPTSYETVGTIPAAYRPAERIVSMGLNVSTDVRRTDVTAGGAFRVEGTGTTTQLAVNMVWPIA